MNINSGRIDQMHFVESSFFMADVDLFGNVNLAIVPQIALYFVGSIASVCCVRFYFLLSSNVDGVRECRS